MRKMNPGFLWLVVLGMLWTRGAYADPLPLSLVLNPANGAISGAPGDTIGWGFTLTNPDNTFAVITSASFCGSILTSPCSTPLGNFTDFIAQFNFTVIGPNGTESAVYDPLSFTGIGSYTINSGAAGGDSFFGQLVLTYDLYTDINDPLSLIGSDNRLSAAASVSVTGASPTSVPAPGTLSLMSSALAGLYMMLRRRQSQIVSKATRPTSWRSKTKKSLTA